MRDALPTRLVTGPRVLKHNRGNDGQGVWKVEAVGSDGPLRVCVTEALSDEPPREMALDAFLERCEAYFIHGGVMIDQPFQERITEGMIRCYMAADEVTGFAHQYPKGLLPPGHVRPHADKRMFPPDAAAFQPLRTKMEGEWVSQMMEALQLSRQASTRKAAASWSSLTRRAA